MKRLLSLIVIGVATLAIAAIGFAEPRKTMPITENKLIVGDEPVTPMEYYPYNPGIATDSPGEIVGYTYYDYQTNGSTGNRVALCDDGSRYFAWMMLEGIPYPPAARHVFYNWIDPMGEWFAEGVGSQVSENTGSGYTTLDIINGNIGAIAYHWAKTTPPDEVFVSTEWDPPGLGIWDHHPVPNQVYPQTPQSPGIMNWPYIAVDRNNNIHIASSENTDRRLQRLSYTRSEYGEYSWTSLQLVDTVMVISSVIDASPVSDRVVMAYAKCADTLTQWNNDIVYFVSDDGTTWDWRYGMNNITNYGTDDDSLWAYTDLDVIIDYDDYIHLIWNAQWTVDNQVHFRTFLFHYSEETGEINEITAWPDSLWFPISGVWNRPVAKMNLGVQEESNGIFAIWTQLDTSDVSASNYGNGELYMSYSYTGGATWAIPQNITNSHSHGCWPGECDSDNWASLADVVDESLHIFYVEDKDAGGSPQDEGAWTENPMRYLRVPTPPVGIDDYDNRPVNFSLNQNYPNPFNAKTIISFTLKEYSSVTIEIFDITGAKVTTLVDNEMTAGNHQAIWDASAVASGVYFYKLTAGNESETRQMALIK